MLLNTGEIRFNFYRLLCIINYLYHIAKVMCAKLDPRCRKCPCHSRCNYTGLSSSLHCRHSQQLAGNLLSSPVNQLRLQVETQLVHRCFCSFQMRICRCSGSSQQRNVSGEWTFPED